MGGKITHQRSQCNLHWVRELQIHLIRLMPGVSSTSTSLFSSKTCTTCKHIYRKLLQIRKKNFTLQHLLLLLLYSSTNKKFNTKKYLQILSELRKKKSTTENSDFTQVDGCVPNQYRVPSLVKHFWIIFLFFYLKASLL